jgi:hypothetical protein
MMSREDVLKLLGPEREPDRVWQSFESHLARAKCKWMARIGTCFDAAGRALMANYRILIKWLLKSVGK